MCLILKAFVKSPVEFNVKLMALAALAIDVALVTQQ